MSSLLVSSSACTSLRRCLCVRAALVGFSYCSRVSCQVFSSHGSTGTLADFSIHGVLEQLRLHSSRELAWKKRHNGRERQQLQVQRAEQHGAREVLSREQLLTWCEQLCNPEVWNTCSVEEWSDAVQLLLCAMARRRPHSHHKETTHVASEKGESEKGTDTSLWAAAMRLFLSSTPSKTEGSAVQPHRQQVSLCEALLRCCVQHGAPVNVCRAVYQTLRTCFSSETTMKRADENASDLHVMYARFLLKIAAPVEKAFTHALYKEALRVLLLDAAVDGSRLHPMGLFLSLELLRRMVTEMPERTTSLSSARQEPESENSTVDDAFWNHLQCGSNVTTVARDIYSSVLNSQTVSLPKKQEAFCHLVAVGIHLSVEELSPFVHAFNGSNNRKSGLTLRTGRDARHPPQPPEHGQEKHLFVQILDTVSDLLSSNATERETLGYVLSEPYVVHSYSSRTTHFVSVWLIQCILRGLRFFHHHAIHGGAVQGCDSALEAWEQCTQAALRCLQRVLLYLPKLYGRHSEKHGREQWSVRCARQEAFCLIFQCAFDGVFYGETTHTTPRERVSAVMITLTQAYGECDWRGPSVVIAIKCLHAWGMYDLLRRIFCEVYRRDEKRWYSEEHNTKHNNKNNNRDKNNSNNHNHNSDSTVLIPRQWRSPLCLFTCQLVVQSACDHNDPATAALAIAHMLRRLLVAELSESTGAINTMEEEHEENEDEERDAVSSRTAHLTEGRSVGMWTRLIHEELIPRVDEVYCRTGIDTSQEWLGDLGLASAIAAVDTADAAGTTGGTTTGVHQ